ncbi:hypothetical protein ACQUSR_24810 [Streptomyces sp. P1-3]|uniref:hypothetical protein n=1 Tax=Streptomyces sp. P1-3 TaxID=3421658 RepID=UPI003D36EEB3
MTRAGAVAGPTARTALGRAARAEWGPLLRALRDGLRDRKAAAVALTLTAVCLTGLFQYVQNQPWGFGPVRHLGAVQADQPWWSALLRTPLSLYVPALDLPVWGALAQLLLAFGIAEICVGPLRTLLVAYAATLAGTLYARLGIAVGPGGLLGLPGHEAHTTDTGPSAAVVGLAVYVCWRYRAWFTCAVVAAAMVVEAFVKPNLAGKEHVAAVVAVLALCVAGEVRQRMRRQGPGGPAGPRGPGGPGGSGRSDVPEPESRPEHASRPVPESGSVPEPEPGPGSDPVRGSEPVRGSRPDPESGPVDSENPPSQSWSRRRHAFQRLS